VKRTLTTLRAAAWCVRALGSARRQLQRGALQDVRLPGPPPVPDDAARGVRAALRLTPSSCLERALVLQAWHAAHGRPQDVVIGVSGRTSDFRAHAWLENEPQEGAGFRELARVAPR
jgi:hypothetical protein